MALVENIPARARYSNYRNRDTSSNGFRASAIHAQSPIWDILNVKYQYFELNAEVASETKRQRADANVDLAAHEVVGEGVEFSNFTRLLFLFGVSLVILSVVSSVLGAFLSVEILGFAGVAALAVGALCLSGWLTSAKREEQAVN